MRTLSSALLVATMLVSTSVTAQDEAGDASAPASSVEARPNSPRLILQITVDQLRGDLPTRYYDRFGDGGFRYLWESGVVYRNAHHAHANTETIVGHATLATGTNPAIHGMVGNLWFDRQAGVLTYNVEDANYRLLTEGADVDDDAEIDPTQRAARSEGRSPAAIKVTTFADELRSNSGGAAKVFAVSVKDRGAISMAGHSGTAYWFSKASGGFVTSTYYMDRYPDWVIAHNASNPAQKFAGMEWTLLNEPSSYLFRDSDDRDWETDVAGFGRIFPHSFGDGSSRYFTTWLTLSPAGDRLVLDFAKKALIEEGLGADEVTDYLSVSFSSTDYVGHVFGPSSLEAEDNILQLDHTLADLLAYVDDTVGLENTLIVLSADHGGPDTPGYLQSLGIPAGYLDPDSWESSAAIDRIKQQFGIDDDLIQTYAHPYLYLNTEAIDAGGIDKGALEAAIIGELVQFEGVSSAVSSSAMRRNAVPDTPINRLVLNNFYDGRSGDIYVVFESNWFINDFDGLTVASTHGSPWSYDTYVPIVFAGAGLTAKSIDRRVHTVDVAPTIAALLRIKPPSGSVGDLLYEVLTKEVQ